MIGRPTDTARLLANSFAKDEDAKLAVSEFMKDETWLALERILQEKADKCDEQVTRFVRADNHRTMEQVVIDNNQLTSTADALRFVPSMLKAVLDLDKVGR